MSDLAYVLRHLPHPHDASLLVGDNPADDAAIYRMRDDLALVQTVDFFTPVVDDPFTYGMIAVANSLSDVYAMGGEPRIGLNIVCFPMQSLPASALADILRGGAAMAATAGVTIVGGHTVEDLEPKYGLAVTGTVHPERYVSARGARPGDVLVLTKPLGTGVVTTALKAGEAAKSHVEAAVRWMTALNRDAARAMVRAGAHAATDITGFGLLGHLLEMCEASDVSAVVNASAVPLLPGALEYARQGTVPGGSHTNLSYLKDRVEIPGALDSAVATLLTDAQTSGGLLVSLPPETVHSFSAMASPAMLVAVVGKVEADGPPTVRVDV